MRKTHIFCGTGQLPEDTDLFDHKYVTLLLEVDLETGIIIDSYVPVYCDMLNQFLLNIFRGKSLDVGIKDIIDEIDARLHVISEKALIVALRSLYNRYLTHKRNYFELEK